MKSEMAPGWRSEPLSFILFVNSSSYLKMGATGFDGIRSLLNCMRRSRNSPKSSGHSYMPITATWLQLKTVARPLSDLSVVR